MTELCPSCREPLDYPSGDGCAAMTKHKVKPMTKYDETREASSRIAERFSQTLLNLKDDFND